MLEMMAALLQNNVISGTIGEQKQKHRRNWPMLQGNSRWI